MRSSKRNLRRVGIVAVLGISAADGETAGIAALCCPAAAPDPGFAALPLLAAGCATGAPSASIAAAPSVLEALFTSASRPLLPAVSFPFGCSGLPPDAPPGLAGEVMAGRTWATRSTSLRRSSVRAERGFCADAVPEPMRRISSMKCAACRARRSCAAANSALSRLMVAACRSACASAEPARALRASLLFFRPPPGSVCSNAVSAALSLAISPA